MARLCGLVDEFSGFRESPRPIKYQSLRKILYPKGNVVSAQAIEAYGAVEV